MAIISSILGPAILLTMTVFIIQIISAASAAKFTGNFSFSESMLIGFGMLGRAELAFVVMDIAYVDYQIFTTEVFYTLMVTCFALNLCVPLTLRFWKPYLLASKLSN